MAYSFAPSNSSYDRSWAYWLSGFNFDEINKIIALGESLNPSEAKITGTQVTPMTEAEVLSHRNSHVSWIKNTADTTWLYEKLSKYVREINELYFGFDLWGFDDSLQYTVYDARRGPEHYDWHVDNSGKGTPCRKLSLTLQLSDPMDYEGGELWIHGLKKEVVPKLQGYLIVFPSYTLHRVTPVTTGIRRSLVAWVTGPDYR